MSVKEEIDKVFQERIVTANQKKQSRQREIYEKIPMYRTKDEEYRKLLPKIAIYPLKHREHELPALKKKIETLKNELKSLLILNGFKENYLEDVYQCSICKDTGAGTCKCYAMEQSKILLEQSGLKSLVDNSNFKDFKLEYYQDKDKANHSLNTSRAFVKELLENKNTNRNILFTGTAGTGKTFLSSCIAKELINNGVPVIYKMANDLVGEILEIEYKGNRELKKLLYESQVLIIDDLGTEIVSDKRLPNVLFSLINTRLIDKKNTIISTNLNPKALKDTYTERVYSRIISNYDYLSLVTDDIRILQRKEYSNPRPFK